MWNAVTIYSVSQNEFQIPVPNVLGMHNGILTCILTKCGIVNQFKFTNFLKTQMKMRRTLFSLLYCVYIM